MWRSVWDRYRKSPTLVQATNADGVPLYVDANGETVTNPPANLVEDFFPLYLDEGEITFSKSGEIVSPKNKVRYEQQASWVFDFDGYGRRVLPPSLRHRLRLTTSIRMVSPPVVSTVWKLMPQGCCGPTIPTVRTNRWASW